VSARQPSEHEISFQFRASLRRVSGVDVHLYADALHALGLDNPGSYGQRTGVNFGYELGRPIEQWWRLGLQAAF